MSTVSKVTFGMACLTSASIIYYVHYRQMVDRDRMHQGVIRDQNALEMKRRQNIQELNQQQVLTQMLKEQEQIGNNSL